MNPTLPATQYAVQLVGPDRLELNRTKPVPQPGPHEVLIQVEAVGLCFSDLKLLKQFDGHARKGAVVSGLPAAVLAGIQSYVPGPKPTVPGHEVVCRIVAVGGEVKQHHVGERCLVQTDYRGLPTAGSCAAFGYNFEGGLQEYVILDERVILDATGQRFLIPVGPERSASAVALVEPWACVEDSYVTPERRHVKAGGRLLVVAGPDAPAVGVEASYDPQGPPAQVETIAPAAVAAAAADETYDDVIYFGADPAVLSLLDGKLAVGGIVNVVLGGRRIGAPVSVGVGRVHYARTRWIGTTGNDAHKSYRHIPATGEVRRYDRVVVLGGGGPMGQMHVLRDLSAAIPGVSLVATDFDDARLQALAAKAGPLAEAHDVPLRLVNTGRTPLTGKYSYFALMAPVPALVAYAIAAARPGTLINIFAGIPAGTRHDLDLDTYLANRCYMFGTSGSTIEDMKIVLAKVESGKLDTNRSLDAVSGMAGAAEGIRAIENRTLAGKIIVYPTLHELGLIPLSRLAEQFPTVAAKLRDGQWTKEAEAELLAVAGK
jgi:threonine dehydrogenase-like Zn-dependent dehydrogenase